MSLDTSADALGMSQQTIWLLHQAKKKKMRNKVGILLSWQWAGYLPARQYCFVANPSGNPSGNSSVAFPPFLTLVQSLRSITHGLAYEKAKSGLIPKQL